jgi:glycosyltransferase involved in cell wall biosynthesis
MTKFNVLEVIRQGKIGGGETHMLDLIRHMDLAKFKPYVLSFTDGPMIDSLNELGIPNTVIPTKFPFDFRVWKSIKKLLEREGINLVHAHGSRAASNLLIPAKKCNIPLIYTVHGWSFHDDQSPLVKKIRIKSEKYISDRTTMNISVSVSNQITGKKNFGKYQSTVVNNGINLGIFNPDGEFKDIRKELKIPSDRLVISCLNRMTIQKDPITMIKAFTQALKEEPKLHLLLVGDGDLKTAAIAEVDKLKIKEHVTFEQFRSDVVDILAATDIYCLPSLWEGLPIGLLEAMGMSVPVIATDVDGSREIVNNRQNGLLIPPRDVSALTNAILTMVREEELRDRMAQMGRNTVEERFGVERMVKKIETIYINLLSE